MSKRKFVQVYEEGSLFSGKELGNFRTHGDSI